MRPVQNERGILTLDLVFGLSLVLGVMIIVLALGMTLMSIEVAQYMAYSVSRAYFSAQRNEGDQNTAGQKKWADLQKKPAFRMIFGNGMKGEWFSLDGDGPRDFTPDYKTVSDSARYLQGFQIKFTAKLLSFNVPFFGRTSEDGLSTKVNSLLGREPTQDECMGVLQQRYDKFKALGVGNTTTGTYYVFADNGC